MSALLMVLLPNCPLQAQVRAGTKTDDLLEDADERTSKCLSLLENLNVDYCLTDKTITVICG